MRWTRYLVATLFPLALVELTGPLHAQGTGQPCGGVFLPVADAFVKSDAPSSVYGEFERLSILRVDVVEWRALLRFDLGSAIPPGSAIQSAVLELTLDAATSQPWFAEVRAITEEWNEGSIRWSNQPAHGDPAGVAGSHLTASGEVVGLDVSAVVNQWTTGAQTAYGIELSVPESQGLPQRVDFFSREGGPGPRLVVTCAAPLDGIPIDPEPLDASQQADLERLRAESSRPVTIRLESGAVRFASFAIPVPGSVGPDPLAGARWFLGEYRGLIRLPDPDLELQLDHRSPDGRHLFFRQLHGGIPVYPGEVIVHTGDQEVVGLTGHYVPEIVAPPGPSITPERAAVLARAAAGAEAAQVADARLRYLNRGLLGMSDAATRLTWQVTVAGGAGAFVAYVDAVSGEILFDRARPQEAFRLSLNTGSGAPEMGGGANLCWWPTGADIEWFTESGQRPMTSPDAEGFTANTRIGAIDSFWRTSFGRDGHAGRGGHEVLYLDVFFSPLNATYNFFCDILQFGNDMSTLDVMGHEYTHGVIWSEFALVGPNESGTLNESYADLFGFFVDPGNVTIGEGTGGIISRNLANPTLTSQPDHVSPLLSGDGIGQRRNCNDPADCLANDFGFVHTNTGIPNKAGYLIIAGGTHNGRVITGMGNAKAARLFFNVITNRLGLLSTFLDARDAAVAEASTGTGFSAFDVCQVKNAYASVGLGVGDADCDGVDDVLESDADNDGVPNATDNCPLASNPGQADMDRDTLGNTCDPDIDGDGDANGADNCLLVFNPAQADFDGDGPGDSCDDSDGDGVTDNFDNCRTIANPTQSDHDNDRQGDVCDPDRDDDLVLNGSDNCPDRYNPSQSDTPDGDGIGNLCDTCPGLGPSADHADPDKDGLGNGCDPDDDNDGRPDAIDGCPLTYNPVPIDHDHNGTEDACDVGIQQSLFEDPGFWRDGRLVRWDLNLPIEIPIPICPVCGGEGLPNGLDVVADLSMDTPFRVRLVDGDGLTVAAGYSPAQQHRLTVRPRSYARSAFDYGSFPSSVEGRTGGPAQRLPYVRPDQTHYTLLLYPADGADLSQDYSLTIDYEDCRDADTDGAPAGDPTCLSGAIPDCDDLDPSRAPGLGEACDNVDNDCNGLIDGFATTCGVGECASSGLCSAGSDSCLPGAPSPEVCDGLDNDCDQIVDHLAAPAGVPDVSIDASGLSWVAISESTAYDVWRGDLASLESSGGDFSVAGAGCLSHSQPILALSDPEIPPPGNGFLYIVRPINCSGPGTYDTLVSSQSGSRDAEVASSASSCPYCPHDRCVTGARLEAGCGGCAGSVCSVDPYCCQVAWDSICVGETLTVCNSLVCPITAGSCAHPLCAEGAALSAGCDDPPVTPSCVSAICAVDAYCCQVAWDSICVGEVATVCNRTCD